MPPKRKSQASAASASTQKQPAKRRSKLAKNNDINADEEEEIREAFSLFAQHADKSNKEGEIPTQDVRRALIALNAPPTDNEELQEILETVDPDETGWVRFEEFVAVAALKLNAKEGDAGVMDEEVAKAFRLFTKGQERDINLNDLKRVARELREDVPDNVLKDMIREATSGGLSGVGMDDFEGVMRRAGVFGVASVVSSVWLYPNCPHIPFLLSAIDNNFQQAWLCGQCFEAFITESDLTDHLTAAHAGGSKEKCSNCNHSFPSQKALLNHKHDHNDQSRLRMAQGLPRGCTKQSCDYVNESAVAYSMHMMHVHAPTCGTCGQKFHEFAELAKHRGSVGCVPKKAEAEVPKLDTTALTATEEGESVVGGGDDGQSAASPTESELFGPPTPTRGWNQDVPGSEEASTDLTATEEQSAAIAAPPTATTAILPPESAHVGSVPTKPRQSLALPNDQTRCGVPDRVKERLAYQ